MGVSLFALQRFMDAEAAYFSSIRVSACSLGQSSKRLLVCVQMKACCRNF